MNDLVKHFGVKIVKQSDNLLGYFSVIAGTALIVIYGSMI